MKNSRNLLNNNIIFFNIYVWSPRKHYGRGSYATSRADREEQRVEY